MMEFSKEDLKILADYEAEICISIFIPVHSYGVEVNEMQDAIRLKAQLLQVRKILIEKIGQRTRIEALLKPAFELIEQRSFWNEQQKGLALLISDEFFKCMKLPFKPQEMRFINSSFYLTPLLELLHSGPCFYLLVLSLHDSRFYQGDAFHLWKMEIEGLPNGMDDVIHYEEKGGKQLMRRSGAGAGKSSTQGASFHGHGAGIANDTDYLLQYLKEVDQTLWTSVLSTNRFPLLLAGVDYVTAHYRQISRYQFIANETLQGNFEREDERTLFAIAKEKLKNYFEAPSDQALKTYYDNSSTQGLSSFLPEDVIPASFYGKVSDLFIQKGEHLWGSFDHITNQLKIHEEAGNGDTCLLNKAAIKTIQNGGQVHVLEKERMPSDTKIAAFMRY